MLYIKCEDGLGEQAGFLQLLFDNRISLLLT